MQKLAANILRLFTLTCGYVFFCCLIANAQVYKAPVNYKMSAKADYQRYEADVIRTVDWLQATPWTEQPLLRRQATDFLFKWIQDTPTITVEVMPALMNLTDKNNKLMAIFMGAYAKYAIEHPTYNKDEANMAAAKALVAKYKAEPTHKKDYDVEQLIKLEKDDQLLYWVRNEYERTDK